jgi:hypothetical protein
MLIGAFALALALLSDLLLARAAWAVGADEAAGMIRCKPRSLSPD